MIHQATRVFLIYVQNEEQCEAVLERIYKEITSAPTQSPSSGSLPFPVVGLDMEWRPNRSRKEAQNQVALVQISSPRVCALIQVHLLRNVESCVWLTKLLGDPR